MSMQIDIYGFKATVTRDGKYLVGEIPELHIADQAGSLNELEIELKDAVSLVVDFILKDEKNASKGFSASVIRRLKVQLVEA